MNLTVRPAGEMMRSGLELAGLAWEGSPRFGAVAPPPRPSIAPALADYLFEIVDALFVELGQFRVFLLQPSPKDNQASCQDGSKRPR